MADLLKYVVCGEALFDVFVKRGEAIDMTSLSLEAKAGGSPFNVAIGLSRLGRRSTLLTGISNDFLGERLMAVLVKERVLTEFIQRKNAPTTMALVQLDDAGIPAYSFYGLGAADRLLTTGDVDIVLNEKTVLHLGSYSIVAQPTADALFSLVKKYTQRCLISLDPNIRPMIEPNMDIWRKRLNLLIPLVDIIKVSDEDLEVLYPEKTPEMVITQWQQLGDKLFVLTRGHEGATLYTKKHTVKVSVPVLQVVDTVGAGDTFQAALLDAIGDFYLLSPKMWIEQLTKEKLTNIGQYAACAAAITCTKRGANLPRKTEILKLEQRGETGHF